MSADMLDIGEEEMSSLYKALIVLQNAYLDLDDDRQHMTKESRAFSDRLFDSIQLIKEIVDYG